MECCFRVYPSAHWRPFPTQRLNNTPLNFVGAANEGEHTEATCPEECRPRQHQDWILC